MRVNGPACVTRKTVGSLSGSWHGQRLSAAFRITCDVGAAKAVRRPARRLLAKRGGHFGLGVLTRSNLYARRPNLADGLDGLGHRPGHPPPAPGCSGPAFLAG